MAIGEAHHITDGGIARQASFHSAGARSGYLQVLEEQAARHKVRVLGYCLMRNHVHLVAIPQRRAALARMVRFAHGPSAQYANTELGRTSHFWQKRFYSSPVENTAVGRVFLDAVYVKMRTNGVVENRVVYASSIA